MVYVYKKIVGGEPYYYLRASERKGRRVIAKDLAYLGNSIGDVRKNLNNLPQYKEDIRKAYKTMRRFLESNHYLEKVATLKLKKDEFLEYKQAGVEACRLHYNNVFKKQDESTRREILKNFVIEFAFNTTSIEGNTIKLSEARKLLEEGKTPKEKTLREIYDLQNTERVLFGLFESRRKLSHELITEIHSNLMENIDNREGYRTRDVRVIKANFEATPAPYVGTDMGLLLKWYNKSEKKMHPLVLATIFHHKFEKIHPFMDGNGRVGRMVLNYILMRKGYPPVIIHKKSRSDYLDALRDADKSGLTKADMGGYANLVRFVADEMSDYYWDLFL